MNRKGVFVDSLFFLVMMFAVAIGLVIAWIGTKAVLDGLMGAPVDTTIKTTLTTPFYRLDSVWDGVFVMLIVGVSLAILVTSYVLASNPAFFFIFLLIVSLFGVMSGYFANAYEIFESDALVSPAASSFPGTSFIMENYLYYVIVLVVLMVIVFFAKPRDAGTF